MTPPKITLGSITIVMEIPPDNIWVNEQYLVSLLFEHEHAWSVNVLDDGRIRIQFDTPAIDQYQSLKSFVQHAYETAVRNTHE